MTDQPSIESLRQAVGRIEIPDDQYAIHRALDELERLRLIEAGDRDSEALVTRLLKGSAHTDLEAHDARVRREALEAGWARMGNAPDPLQPGYYVCNYIEASRWAALEEALFIGTENTAPREEETK